MDIINLNIGEQVVLWNIEIKRKKKTNACIFNMHDIKH